MPLFDVPGCERAPEIDVTSILPEPTTEWPLELFIGSPPQDPIKALCALLRLAGVPNEMISIDQTAWA